MVRLADPAAWLTICVTAYIVCRSRPLSTDPALRWIVGTAVAVRTVYSIANIVVGPLFGLEIDAEAFHAAAANFAGGGELPVGPISGGYYSAGLGALYRVTRGGQFFGQQLSVLAVAVMASSLVRIMAMLGVSRRRRRWVLALVLFLPAGIVFTAGTLREAFQQLFFVLTAELALRIMRRTTLATVSAMALTVALGATLHGALAFAGATTALAATVIACVRRDRVRSASGAVLRFALIVLVLVTAAVALSRPRVFFPYDVSGGALSAASAYREGTTAARADYLRLGPGQEVTLSTFPRLFRLYQASPLPWEASNSADVIATIEALIRAALVVAALLAIVHVSRGAMSRLTDALLVVGAWLALELAWSLGTTNWGTAARHHLVAFPLLVVAGAMCPKMTADRVQQRWALRHQVAAA